MHRTLVSFIEAELALLLVFWTNLAWRRSFLNRFVWCSAELAWRRSFLNGFVWARVDTKSLLHKLQVRVSTAAHEHAHARVLIGLLKSPPAASHTATNGRRQEQRTTALLHPRN